MNWNAVKAVCIKLTILVLDNNVPDAASGAGIDPCGGFIQNHQTRAPNEGNGD